MNIGLFVGILAAVTVTTIHNERIKKEYQEKQKKEKFKTDLKIEDRVEIKKNRKERY